MGNQHASVDFVVRAERVDWKERGGGDGDAGEAEEVDEVVV